MTFGLLLTVLLILTTLKEMPKEIIRDDTQSTPDYTQSAPTHLTFRGPIIVKLIFLFSFCVDFPNSQKEHTEKRNTKNKDILLFGRQSSQQKMSTKLGANRVIDPRKVCVSLQLSPAGYKFSGTCVFISNYSLEPLIR